MSTTIDNHDIAALARELLAAQTSGASLDAAPSARLPDFDLPAAYNVEREIARLREQSGHRVRGVKVGFANKAIWRALKLETLVWASMYDDTVHQAPGGSAELSLGPRPSQRLEPEIVFSLKRPIDQPGLDPITVLRDHVEWIALGFEIIDCPFNDWKFQPTDFVAALGLHRALIIGEPLPLAGMDPAQLADQLAQFTVRLSRNGELAEQGAGKNSLRSPALCLAELGAAIARQNAQSGQAAPVGTLVSSGSLTTARDIATGDLWRAEVEGLPVKPLELRVK